ncbi:MAG: hypothetical protein KDA79_24510, partial [Planctomycetaceae bacterium]|nr:hypothetical protein [Planctomycetaceae bacterium]
MLLLLVAAAVCSSSEAVAQQQPQVRYLTTNFSLKNADIAKLNRRLSLLGIGLPFSVAGKVTTDLKIGVPLRKLRESRLYRINGTITSPKLTVAEVELTDISADVVYRDGVLSLQPLLVSIPEGAKSDGQAASELRPGRFRGTAEMKLVPRGDLSLTLQFDQIPVRPLAAAAADILPVDEGRLTGTVNAAAPVDRLTEPAAWNGAGRLTVSSLSLIGQTWKQ